MYGIIKQILKNSFCSIYYYYYKKDKVSNLDSQKVSFPTVGSAAVLYSCFVSIVGLSILKIVEKKSNLGIWVPKGKVEVVLYALCINLIILSLLLWKKNYKKLLAGTSAEDFSNSDFARYFLLLIGFPLLFFVFTYMLTRT